MSSFTKKKQAETTSHSGAGVKSLEQGRTFPLHYKINFKRHI